MIRYYRNILLCFFYFSLISGQAQSKYSYTHPIPFQPESYVCLKAIEPIIIDGKDTESSWEKAVWTNDFVDIEGDQKPKPYLKTNVKMIWDDQALYFYAKLYEPHVWAKLKLRDTVIFYDDDFEIFIDPDGDTHNYYEIEVNALNTVWDLFLLKPYRADHLPNVMMNWNLNNMKSAVHVEGSLNNAKDIDKFWAVECAIPWSALREFASKSKIPDEGDQWRINFSRVDWDMNNDNYSKLTDPKTDKSLPERNWVWSPTGFINMHMPETWGFVQFSKNPVGTNNIFVKKEDEQIKWGLWNLYWQMRKYHKEHDIYTNELANFSMPKVDNCNWQPEVFITPYHFEITNPSCDNKGKWIIQTDGRIYLKVE